MIQQTVLPLMWIIVSDGSTDGTDALVQKYTEQYGWIELVRGPERKERHFAGKVGAFNAGYERVKNLHFDLIGNVDADISFSPDHFEFLLRKFQEDPSLGVAGTAIHEHSKMMYDYDIVNIEHVSGPCQLFRRECYEAIGGYRPIKSGGVDWTAVTTARMMGWTTRTFAERGYEHHRRMGTGMNSLLASRYRFGRQDYYLGGHPLWELFRGIYQMKNTPYILGGGMILMGYYWSMLTGVDKQVSKELEAFRKKEQMQRLRMIIRKRLHLPWTNHARTSEISAKQ
jgi:glycosyltransferase involved in cell wall biosynthesis